MADSTVRASAIWRASEVGEAVWGEEAVDGIVLEVEDGGGDVVDMLLVFCCDAGVALQIYEELETRFFCRPLAPYLAKEECVLLH